MSRFNPTGKRKRRQSEEEENHVLSPRDQYRWLQYFQKEAGQYWYLVSRSWFNHWKHFCIRSGSEAEHSTIFALGTRPGSITNDDLLFDDNNKLLSDLEENDYGSLPEPIWEKLVEWYGFNGLPIKRRMISNGFRLEIELYPPVITTYVIDMLGELKDVLKPVKIIVSEKSLLKDTLRVIKARYKIRLETEIRLWNSPTSLEGLPFSIKPQYLMNASEINITDQKTCVNQSGDCTWIVELKADDKFPSDMVDFSAVYLPNGRCGLVNAGNTCYMNSALQCLSNTPELTRWFLSGKYTEEINRDNILGMNGEVAEAYGKLIERIWTTEKICLSAASFKSTMGKFNATFSDFQQHDTQEFLAFLLDGLHEDLNRITQKPYVELPDFDGCKDEEVAEFSWKYHLARNNSIIVDLFQGQFKSKLVCKTCQNVSTTFDPFMYLSLPLPVKEKPVILQVYYVPYHWTQHEKKIRVTVPRDSDIAYLQEKVASIIGGQPEKLLVADIYHRKIYKVFNPDDPISSIHSKDIIFIYELPCTVPIFSKKKALKRHGLSVYLDEEKQDSNQQPVIIFPVYCIFIGSDQDLSPQRFGYPFIMALSLQDASSIDQIYSSILCHLGRQLSIKKVSESLPSDLLSTLEPMDCDQSPQQQSIQISVVEEGKPIHPEQKKSVQTEESRPIQSEQEKTIESDQEEIIQPMPPLFEMKVFQVNRRDTFPQHSSCTRFYPIDMINLVSRAEAMKTSLNAESEPKEETKEETKEEIMTELNKNEKQEDQSISTSVDELEEHGLLFKEDTERKGTHPKPLIQQGEGVELVWNEREAEQYFGASLKDTTTTNLYIHTCFEWEDVIDPDTKDLELQKPITLFDCLNEFTREEDLCEEDLWYCSKCKEQQPLTKKLDIWKLPNILVIQLKRFSGTSIWGDKIEEFIDFPINELDMTDHVLSIKDPEGERQIYDLYAVNNHYGGLGSGHYTACAQNEKHRDWYLFDDSKVTYADESDIKTAAAYLLFYKRRD